MIAGHDNTSKRPSQLAQLYHVSPLDPASYVIAPIVFLLSGLAAAYSPSRQATCVDPVVVLRHD
jgi:hypothetical protein